MKIAPALHPLEDMRLEELYRYKILDSESEELYNNITVLASQICETPICAISFVDKERVWFKAAGGLEVNEVPRDVAFCSYTVLQPDLLVIEDTKKDTRFADNPLVSGDGDIRFYAGAPIFSSAGLPLGALCVIDKSPRKLSAEQKIALTTLAKQVMLLNEQRMKHEIARLKLFQKRNVISNMTTGIMAVDIKGTVMFSNKAFADMFKLGIPPEFMEGRKYHELIQHFGQGRMKNPQKLVDEISRIMAAKKAIYADEIRSAEGLIIERDFVPVEFEGRCVGYLWTYRDVTEKRQQQQVMADSLKKAEELTHLKSQFLANMSHEIRTPLNGIIGMSGLLLDSTLDGKQNELSVNIRECGESLLEIVNDILDYSKIEANKLELLQEPFTLTSCLDQSIYILDHKASQKGIKLSYRLNSAMPAAVIGDSGRVRQILVNLMGNAVKFTQAGRVEVSVASQLLDDEFVELTFQVKDTGIGIPQDRMDRLFKSFSQVDSSTSRQFGGTGLGLAISKNLCEMMGGTIKVESELGVGTTFTFSVKLKNAKDQVVRLKPTMELPSNVPSSTMQDINILVVDDNIINQKLALGLLEKIGYKADVAGNGLEALELVRRRNYDLILMDVQMPEMSGLEATEVIRKMDLKSQPKIIALTANAMREDEIKCMAVGMNEYMSKPIQPKLLISKIQDLLQSRTEKSA